MYRYPTVREAKTHAKHLSRTFDLKRSEAQEITAYWFNCYDWGELLEKSGAKISIEEVNAVTPFINIFGQSKVDEFKGVVLPHFDAIRKHFNKNIHVHGSILHKILEEKFNQISGNTIDAILHAMNEHQEECIPWDSSELISELEFRDDTVSRILSGKDKTKLQLHNGHIEPAMYGFSFYAYYRFRGKKVDITVREFDLDLCRPSRDGVSNNLSICERGWFSKYFIAYLKLVIQQLRSVGYTGTVRVCKIQNVKALDFYRKRGGDTLHGAVYDLFKELLSMGGDFAWSTDEEGKIWDLGIELSFETSSSQWMFGERTL
ncbi:hypothetical protein CW749_16770 [Vibrio sp. vnigr-6D03]|uniref:hypothetical protein n=1 Tax=Vibrio sp. vnigr-6D03 TaxID=2058088 RepID=UPI000CB56F2E|nr:hypothetical protein [Vibrio sp. vnigr-6D03]PKF78719.1 hypothetical protein CW749_16770 [Vibrio sp. vnigr-6D03]